MFWVGWMACLLFQYLIGYLEYLEPIDTEILLWTVCAGFCVFILWVTTWTIFVWHPWRGR